MCRAFSHTKWATFLTAPDPFADLVKFFFWVAWLPGRALRRPAGPLTSSPGIPVHRSRHPHPPFFPGMPNQPLPTNHCPPAAEPVVSAPTGEPYQHGRTPGPALSSLRGSSDPPFKPLLPTATRELASHRDPRTRARRPRRPSCSPPSARRCRFP